MLAMAMVISLTTVKSMEDLTAQGNEGIPQAVFMAEGVEACYSN